MKPATTSNQVNVPQLVSFLTLTAQAIGLNGATHEAVEKAKGMYLGLVDQTAEAPLVTDAQPCKNCTYRLLIGADLATMVACEDHTLRLVPKPVPDFLLIN